MPYVKTIVDLQSEPVKIDDIYNYIRLDETNIGLETALVQSMIVSARQLCEQKTNMAFGEKTLEAYFQKDEVDYPVGSKIYTLQLPFSPHSDVTSVVCTDEAGTVYTLVKDTDYKVVGNKVFELQFKAGFIYETFTVTYKAGFGIQTQGKTTDIIPEILPMAIRKQVAQWYDNRADYEQTLSSEVRRMLNSISLSTWF